MSEVHHEKHFENYIVSKLEENDWLVGSTDHYDIEHALYPDDLVAWLKDTQKAKWGKLKANYGEKAAGALMSRLAEALEEKGTTHILRRGFAIPGCGHLDMSEAARRTSATLTCCIATPQTGCALCRSSNITLHTSTRLT